MAEKWRVVCDECGVMGYAPSYEGAEGKAIQHENRRGMRHYCGIYRMEPWGRAARRGGPRRQSEPQAAGSPSSGTTA